MRGGQCLFVYIAVVAGTRYRLKNDVILSWKWHEKGSKANDYFVILSKGSPQKSYRRRREYGESKSPFRRIANDS